MRCRDSSRTEISPFHWNERNGSWNWQQVSDANGSFSVVISVSGDSQSMAVQATLRRIGFSVERRCSWRVSNDLAPCRRALSDRPGSDVDWMSDKALTRKGMEDAAREDRLDFQTAARLLMSTSQDERKFGWDFHLVQFFFACLPPLAVYAVAQYSRYEQRRMQKDRDARVEKLVAAELEIEVGVELEEVSAMLNSRNPDLEALRLRLEAMEDRLMRLEPIIHQTGSRSERTSFPHQESNSSVSQQETDLPKPVNAGSDSVGSVTNEKNR